jgi:hypothetical protein
MAYKSFYSEILKENEPEQLKKKKKINDYELSFQDLFLFRKNITFIDILEEIFKFC